MALRYTLRIDTKTGGILDGDADEIRRMSLDAADLRVQGGDFLPATFLGGRVYSGGPIPTPKRARTTRSGVSGG